MTVDDAPYTVPAADEVVIRNQAVAINPADIFIQKTGMLVKQYPAILGSDPAGIFEAVGSDLISILKPGDRVIGNATYKEQHRAAFQNFVVLKMPLISKIPDDMTFADAVVLPVGITAAASCLFESDTLGLTMPPGSHGKKRGTLLIWGASGSVGSCGVQFASAARYEVFAIASKHNHDYLRSIGASRCFDRGSATVTEEVVEALTAKDNIVGAFDALSKEETLHALCAILHRSGGRKVVAAVLPGAESFAQHDVIIKTNFAVDVASSGVGAHIWRNVLEPALSSGNLLCKPTAEIVGHGLQDIQKAVDLLAKGVIAKKLVVTL